MLSVMPTTSVLEAHIPSIKHYPTVEIKEAYEYDFIIFYRWLSPDLYERGRVMARLVAEMIEKKTRRVWLDQHQMTRSTEAGEVTKRISQTFLSVSQIIILAAPGDWHRFSNMDDIHRWEWEMSLRSDKQIWLLQYGTPDNAQAATKEQLEAEMSTRCPRLAKLFVGRELHIRSLSMDNIDVVLGEIAEAR